MSTLLEGVALRALLDQGVRVGLSFRGSPVASVQPREVRWLFDSPGMARADVTFEFDREVEFDAGSLVVDGEVVRVLPLGGAPRFLAGMSFVYHVHLSVADHGGGA